jgi:hypothetical protein
MSEHDHRDGPSDPSSPPSRDGTRGPTLPPPAFPPGSRRTDARRHLQHDELRDAFISPDEPFERASHGDDDEDFDPDDVVVTGIGDDPHLDPLELSPGGDPYVRELADMVGKLAEALRRRGEAGLQTLPGMSTFEGTLRAYCVGYLRGLHARDEQG